MHQDKLRGLRRVQLERLQQLRPVRGDKVADALRDALQQPVRVRMSIPQGDSLERLHGARARGLRRDGVVNLVDLQPVHRDEDQEALGHPVQQRLRGRLPITRGEHNERLLLPGPGALLCVIVVVVVIMQPVHGPKVQEQEHPAIPQLLRLGVPEPE